VLGQDVDWLTEHFRPDALRDLGERLGDLGGDLTARAADLNTITLAKLPASRWIPEAGTHQAYAVPPTMSAKNPYAAASFSWPAAKPANAGRNSPSARGQEASPGFRELETERLIQGPGHRRVL
jgi:hypothetical protein